MLKFTTVCHRGLAGKGFTQEQRDAHYQAECDNPRYSKWVIKDGKIYFKPCEHAYGDIYPVRTKWVERKIPNTLKRLGVTTPEAYMTHIKAEPANFKGGPR